MCTAAIAIDYLINNPVSTGNYSYKEGKLRMYNSTIKVFTIRNLKNSRLFSGVISMILYITGAYTR